jgi:hypothetical protein
MMHARAGKVILPVFQKLQLCDAGDHGAQPFARQAGFEEELYYRGHIETAVADDRHNQDKCNLFPVVTNACGRIWEPALRYLAHRVFDLGDCTIATNQNVAEDLMHFKRFLDQKNLKYDKFDSPANYELPTYRYRNYLQRQFESGLLPASSAKRRLQSVVGFYRYLITKEIINPAFPPWQKRTISVHIQNSKGLTNSKVVETSDLRIKVREQPNPYSETIDDGGKLRPLSWEHQLLLVKGLMARGNPEMTLIHLIAIFTGARIQTILTLKSFNFPPAIINSSTDFKLKVGPGTHIDTKSDKIIFLYFPLWLCERICTYATSPRASNRRTRAMDDHRDYLFLTKYGRPYYEEKETIQQFDPEKSTRYNSNGQEVRKYKAGLINKIKLAHAEARFYYKFHDLRATFGMNLTDAQMQLVREGKITLAQAREYVKFRMGHSSYETTDRYLNYRRNLEFVREIRDSYGTYLSELRDLTLGAAV